MTEGVKSVLRVSSSKFDHEGLMPKDYTCEGSGINPPLNIKDLPAETKSLVLIVEDPDAPEKIFDHWIVWNIPPVEAIEQNSIPGKVGKNSKGQNRYTGPCPPSGTHRYFFKVYALNTLLHMEGFVDKVMVVETMQNHILAYGELIGLYKKNAP